MAAPRNIRCRDRAFQFADQLPGNQERQRVQGIGDRADHVIGNTSCRCDPRQITSSLSTQLSVESPA
jgi:hypothetical protein